MKNRKSILIKGITIVLMLSLAVSLIAGCGKKKDVIKVGSKDYSEQLILGQIAIAALKDAGFDVEDKTNLNGSDKVMQALKQGDLSLYWEYTGTALFVHLKHDKTITDSKEAYELVKSEDAKKDLIWLDYAPFNNTYTVMMRKEDSEKLNIKSITDIANYIGDNPGNITIAGEPEFIIRPDGIPGLEKLYEFKFGDENIKSMDAGITYKALKEKKVDISMGFATDARIAAYNLVNLEDDKKFFPVYNPAPVVRKDILEKYPKIKDIMNSIAKKLDTETMIKLNYEVDIKEREPKEVAIEWLKSEGLIK